MLVFAASNEQQTTSTPTLTGVSFGGQSLTHVISDQVSNGNRTAIAEVWILDEAGIAAAVGTTIVPTWTSSPDTALYSHAVFDHTNQITPVGASATGTATGDTPNPVPVSAVATSSGDAVLSFATAGEIGTYAPQNGFAVGVNQDTTTGGTSAQGSAYKSATGANEAAPMLFVPGAPPWINRQVVITLVINAAP